MPRVIVRPNMFGNAIYFDEPFNGNVTGFMENRPEVGDFLETSMQSNRTAVYQFMAVSHDHRTRVEDSFDGKVRFVGYKDALPCNYYELPEFQLKQKSSLASRFPPRALLVLAMVAAAIGCWAWY